MRTLKSLLILPLLLCEAGRGDATRHERAPAGCDVAAAFAATLTAGAKGGAVVFTVTDERFTSAIRGAHWFKATPGDRQPAAPPPAGLVDGLEKMGMLNAVPRCPSVRKVLKSRRISYGSTRAMASSTVAEPFRATSLTLSLAVVSADGNSAVLASSGDAAGFLHLLERQPDGTWKRVAFSPLWVS